MSDQHINRATGGLRGVINVPGDKSISHRSLMLSALSSGTVRVTHFLRAQDCLSTLAGMRALGVSVDECGDGSLLVHGVGLRGLREPACIIDAGDSGTMLRLLLGLLCAQPFLTTFTGDAALYRRPMGRVINPLRQMGATLVGRDGNRKLPITILPATAPLTPLTYEMPVASAQVKSAILLAGLTAGVPVAIHESHPTRDHTECMLRAFGVNVESGDDGWVRLPAVDALAAPAAIDVPGDISSAAFWLVAASVIPGSDLTLAGVGLNPTRTGVIDVLRRMGADIEASNERSSGGELRGDLRVRCAKLHGVEFGGKIIPRLVDEIPVLAVAAMCAEGQTTITGAGELRVKETDRLRAVASEFNRLSPCVRELDDGLVITPNGSFTRATCRSHDDHRIAMSLAIAGAAMNGVDISSAECVDISYPEFFATLSQVNLTA